MNTQLPPKHLTHGEKKANGAPVPNGFLRRMDWTSHSGKNRWELEKQLKNLRRATKPPQIIKKKGFHDYSSEISGDLDTVISRLQNQLEHEQLVNAQLQKQVFDLEDENNDLHERLWDEQEKSNSLSQSVESQQEQIRNLEECLQQGSWNFVQLGMELDEVKFQCERLENQLNNLNQEFSSWKDRQNKKGSVFLAMVKFTHLGNKIIEQEEIKADFKAKGSVPRKMIEFWTNPLNETNDTYGSPDVNDIDFCFTGSQKQFKMFWEKLVTLTVQTNSTIQGFPFNIADVSPITQKENQVKNIKYGSFTITLVDRKTCVVYKLEIVNDYGEMENAKLDFDVNALTLNHQGITCGGNLNFFNIVENISNKEAVLSPDVKINQQQIYIRIFKMMVAGYKIIGKDVPQLCFDNCDVERSKTICIKYMCQGFSIPKERTIGLMSYHFITKDGVFKCPHCRNMDKLCLVSSEKKGLEIPEIQSIIEIDTEKWMKKSLNELEFWMTRMECDDKEIITKHAISIQGNPVSQEFLEKAIAFSFGEENSIKELLEKIKTRKVSGNGWNHAYTPSPMRSYRQLNAYWFDSE